MGGGWRRGGEEDIAGKLGEDGLGLGDLSWSLASVVNGLG